MRSPVWEKTQTCIVFRLKNCNILSMEQKRHKPNHGHSHSHDHGSLSGIKLLTAIILNVLITIFQVIGGLVSGSLALLTDALHNFSDVLALVISWTANILSRKKSTAEKTFGYRRAEIIAAMINSGTLVVIAVFLSIEAVKRFSTPREIESFWVIILAAMSIAFNGFSVLLIGRDAKQNMNMKAAYLHLFTDMLTSVAVLAGGIAIKYTAVTWIDPALSIGIALYLIYSSFSLLMDTLKVLMQFTPEGLSIEEIEKRICQREHIKNLHHVHIWQLDDHQIHFEAHIGFSKDLVLSDIQKIFGDVREVLRHDFGIAHTTLQPEYGECENIDLIV